MLGHSWKVIPFLVVGMTDQGRTGMQGRPRLPGGLGAVTCHGAVPSCPRRQSWGPGRPCPARGAAEVRPLGPHTVVSRGIASTRVQLGDSSSGPGGGWGREGSCSAPSKSLPSCKHLQGLVPSRETSSNTEGRCQGKQFHISVLIALFPLVSKKTLLWVLRHFH